MKEYKIKVDIHDLLYSIGALDYDKNVHSRILSAITSLAPRNVVLLIQQRIAIREPDTVALVVDKEVLRNDVNDILEQFNDLDDNCIRFIIKSIANLTEEFIRAVAIIEDMCLLSVMDMWVDKIDKSDVTFIVICE